MPSTYDGAAIMLGALRDSGDLWLGLYLSLPGKTGGGQEVNAAGYQRQGVVFGNAAQAGMSNVNVINFPQALADWGQVAGWGLFDAQAGGSLLWYGRFTEPETIRNGSYMFISPEAMTITEGLSCG